QLFTHDRRVFDELFIFENAERRQTTGHREIVASECAGMHDAPIQSTEHFLINRAPRDDRATRDKSTAQALRHGHDIRFEVPMLKSPPFPSSPKSGLNFVTDQKCAV